MKRRHFIKQAGSLSAVLAAGSAYPQAYASPSAPFPRIKPLRLKRGDTIGLLTPGSAISELHLKKARKNLKLLGFQVKLSKHLQEKNHFLAGTDKERIDDLHAMFKDDEVHGILCVRGGYGSMRILSALDYSLIHSHPKVFIGYSDITALHSSIFVHTGLVTFHGPMGSSPFSAFTQTCFEQVLMQATRSLSFRPQEQPYLHPLLEDKKASLPIIIRKGKAKGLLMGGNLSILCALLGTPYAPDFNDKIVFLEDIGEDPYQVDRMLTQLLLSGQLQEAKGIAFGVFTDKIYQPVQKNEEVYHHVLEERLGGLGIPVAYGLPFGHVLHHAMLPMQIEAELAVGKEVELNLLESAVQ